jgi:hypothetical protein
MLTKTKNELGRWVYSFGEEIKPPKKETTTLDFEAITKTLSAMKKWLATEPSLEDASAVAEYEKAHVNRSGAVGEEGCLTLYLEGE